MNGNTVTRINGLLSEEKHIDKVSLSRYLNNKRRCDDEDVKNAINKVCGRESPYYPWERDCEIAEKENGELKIKLKNYDPAFAFHALTPRIIALWITFLLIFFSLTYGRPALDVVVMDRSGYFLSEMYETEKRMAEVLHENEVLLEIIDILTERVETIDEQLEVMDGR